MIFRRHVYIVNDKKLHIKAMLRLFFYTLLVHLNSDVFVRKLKLLMTERFAVGLEVRRGRARSTRNHPKRHRVCDENQHIFGNK